MEDENIWKTENGWSLYTKEYKQRVLDSVGMQMSLQLRSLIEDSFEYIEKKLIGFPTYKRWKKMQQKKLEVGSLDFIDDCILNVSDDEDDLNDTLKYSMGQSFHGN